MSGAYYWQVTMHYEDGKERVNQTLFTKKEHAEDSAASHMRVFSDIVKCTFKRRWMRD